MYKKLYIIILSLSVILLSFPFVHDQLIYGQINLGKLDFIIILNGFLFALLGFFTYLGGKYGSEAKAKRQGNLMLFFLVFSLIVSYLYGNKIIENNKVQWGIGAYEMEFDKTVKTIIPNPVIHIGLTDTAVYSSIADPFAFRYQDKFFCFAEGFNKKENKGEIIWFEAKDGVHWEYKGVALHTDFHISFPFIFGHDSKFKMMVESGETHNILVYENLEFPNKWKVSDTLLSGKPFKDNVLYIRKKIWYLFTSTANNNLLLYYSHNLEGPWIQHPKSPIYSDFGDGSRMAGPLWFNKDTLYRFAQDDYPNYGNNIKSYVVDQLDTLNYEEHQIDLFQDIKGKEAYNSNGIHGISIIPYDSSYLLLIDGY